MSLEGWEAAENCDGRRGPVVVDALAWQGSDLTAADNVTNTSFVRQKMKALQTEKNVRGSSVAGVHKNDMFQYDK